MGYKLIGEFLMLKNLSKLEVQVGEKVYQLLCDMDSPLEHVKEALFQFQKYIGQIEDNVKAQQAQKEAEQTPKPVEDKIEQIG